MTRFMTREEYRGSIGLSSGLRMVPSRNREGAALSSDGRDGEHRAQIRQCAIERLKAEIEVTAQRKETIKKDFRERLEKRETRAVPEPVPVVARPGDRHDSRLQGRPHSEDARCDCGPD